MTRQILAVSQQVMAANVGAVPPDVGTVVWKVIVVLAGYAIRRDALSAAAGWGIERARVVDRSPAKKPPQTRGAQQVAAR